MTPVNNYVPLLLSDCSICTDNKRCDDYLSSLCHSAWINVLALPDLSIWHLVALGQHPCSPRHSAAGRMMFLGFLIAGFLGFRTLGATSKQGLRVCRTTQCNSDIHFAKFPGARVENDAKLLKGRTQECQSHPSLERLLYSCCMGLYHKLSPGTTSELPAQNLRNPCVLGRLAHTKHLSLAGLGHFRPRIQGCLQSIQPVLRAGRLNKRS